MGEVFKRATFDYWWVDMEFNESHEITEGAMVISWFTTTIQHIILQVDEGKEEESSWRSIGYA